MRITGNESGVELPLVGAVVHLCEKLSTNSRSDKCERKAVAQKRMPSDGFGYKSIWRYNLRYDKECDK